MTDDEFRRCLDRYGGDLDRWPATAARNGRLLLASSAAAQALLDETALIERLLSETEPPPPAGLADRIFAAAFGEPPLADPSFTEPDALPSRQAPPPRH